jgi:hypothetical protein
LNSCKSLLFHGGDTGSIPVRDAKKPFLLNRAFHSPPFVERLARIAEALLKLLTAR